MLDCGYRDSDQGYGECCKGQDAVFDVREVEWIMGKSSHNVGQEQH